MSAAPVLVAVTVTRSERDCIFKGTSSVFSARAHFVSAPGLKWRRRPHLVEAGRETDGEPALMVGLDRHWCRQRLPVSVTVTPGTTAPVASRTIPASAAAVCAPATCAPPASTQPQHAAVANALIIRITFHLGEAPPNRVYKTRHHRDLSPDPLSLISRRRHEPEDAVAKTSKLEMTPVSASRTGVHSCGLPAINVAFFTW